MYRKAHTQSAKKWLERLQKENVPFLVCLTFGDKLYAEHMSPKGVDPSKNSMTKTIKEQLSVNLAYLLTYDHQWSKYRIARNSRHVARNVMIEILGFGVRPVDLLNHQINSSPNFWLYDNYDDIVCLAS